MEIEGDKLSKRPKTSRDYSGLEKTYFKTTKQEHVNILDDAKKEVFMKMTWIMLIDFEETATEITISNVMEKKHTHQY